jgi:hypothetical protein
MAGTAKGFLAPAHENTALKHPAQTEYCLNNTLSARLSPVGWPARPWTSLKWTQVRRFQRFGTKKYRRVLTYRGNTFSTPAIRADVGLAGSGRRVLKFVPNKVRYSTLIRDCCTHDAPFSWGILCFFGSSAKTGGSVRFLRMKYRVKVPETASSGPEGLRKQFSKGMVTCLP